jgi:hypothetical protein
MLDQSTLLTIATLIAGFGATVLVFRVGREVEMSRRGETTWVPWCDWLMVAATVSSLVLGVLPSATGMVPVVPATILGMAVNSAATVLIVGYIVAVLAHYRLILGGGRTGKRTNPEPSERWITLLSVVCALVIFGGVGINAIGTLRGPEPLRMEPTVIGLSQLPNGGRWNELLGRPLITVEYEADPESGSEGRTLYLYDALTGECRTVVHSPSEPGSSMLIAWNPCK